MKKGISRREFLKGSAAGAVSLAAMGLLGGCAQEKEAQPDVNPSQLENMETGELPWLGKAPEIVESEIEKTIEVDVIVVGAGLAGVAATRSAAEEGASVAVFEKAAGAQCRSGEFAVINGSLEARWGRDNMDVEEIVDHHMEECGYKCKRSIMDRWAKEGADVFNWFIEAKPDLYICDTTRSEVPDEFASSYLIPIFHPLPEHYDYHKEKFPVYPTSVELKPDQKPVVDANMEKALALNVTPFFGHFVEKLIMEDGRCIGVFARNAESGKYVKAVAAKGVILSTGDYASNKDILKYYCPDVVENNIMEMWMNMDVEGKPTNQGDGLKLGKWAGARIQQAHAPMIHHMGGGAGADGVGVMGIAGFLQLNRAGKRFMNEDIPGQQLENQLELQPGQYAYQFFDAGWRDQLQYMPAGHGVACYYDESAPKNNETYRNYKNQAQLDQAVAEGRCFKADTLEELLSMLEIDQDEALKSIERYNELAKQGKDEDFGKPSQRLFALDQAPFYADRFDLAPMLVCIGGLESDEECHTYDEDRNIIPGLYVAGNIQGNRLTVQYPISLKGVSHSLALFYGYVAGKNAVHQI